MTTRRSFQASLFWGASPAGHSPLESLLTAKGRLDCMPVPQGLSALGTCSMLCVAVCAGSGQADTRWPERAAGNKEGQHDWKRRRIRNCSRHMAWHGSCQLFHHPQTISLLDMEFPLFYMITSNTKFTTAAHAVTTASLASKPTARSSQPGQPGVCCLQPLGPKWEPTLPRSTLRHR